MASDLPVAVHRSYKDCAKAEKQIADLERKVRGAYEHMRNQSGYRDRASEAIKAAQRELATVQRDLEEWKIHAKRLENEVMELKMHAGLSQ